MRKEFNDETIKGIAFAVAAKLAEETKGKNVMFGEVPVDVMFGLAMYLEALAGKDFSLNEVVNYIEGGLSAYKKQFVKGESKK